LTWVLTLWGAMGVKVVCRMLMKSTPGLDFINVLHTAFVPADPKRVKRY